MNIWRDGPSRRILDIVDSTNAEAKRSASEIEIPTWILAHRQTAGVGRMGRAWSSLPGNLHATLALPLEDSKSAALRSFLSGLALRDCCVGLAGRSEQFKLKWPNDLLLNRGKLAGILLECLPRPGGALLLIGFGVNLADAPNIVGASDGKRPRPVSFVGETGILITPLDFLRNLSRSYAKREHQLQEQGFSPLRAAWMSCAEGLGEHVTVQLPDRRLHGLFETIDEVGNAIIVEGGKRTPITAGEMIPTAGGPGAAGY